MGWQVIYLRNKNPNRDRGKAVQEFSTNAVEIMGDFAKGYCEGCLSVLGIKSGYYFVDHFDIIHVHPTRHTAGGGFGS